MKQSLYMYSLVLKCYVARALREVTKAADMSRKKTDDTFLEDSASP